MPKKSNKSKKSIFSSRSEMMKAQEEFYKAHPNSRPLLLTFLILVLLLGFLYYAKYGFALM